MGEDAEAFIKMANGFKKAQRKTTLSDKKEDGKNTKRVRPKVMQPSRRAALHHRGTEEGSRMSTRKRYGRR